MFSPRNTWFQPQKILPIILKFETAFEHVFQTCNFLFLKTDDSRTKPIKPYKHTQKPITNENS